MIGTFARLTIMIAIVCVAFVVFLFVLKVVLFAALLAAVVLAALFMINFLRALSSRSRSDAPKPPRVIS